ncbi:helix-turn-helix domain-containing protein [Microbacterium sp. 18062]|uniref:helix-turn-helix domain-containing protein n=1 Tax=Microbacterium sp. 18062 TaxID=2681410 RepID=UPI0013580548|nr:helix-turn-helix transcriptional regulator [Microbacterium sp. 18062]
MPDDSLAWDEFARELGLNLQRARAQRGISQERAAHAAGISTFTYRKLEKGESNPGTPANPRLRTLLALAEVLGVDVAALLPEAPHGIATGR